MPMLSNGPGHYVTGGLVAQSQIRQKHAADAVHAHDTPPARGGTRLANAIRAASIASTDLAHFPLK